MDIENVLRHVRQAATRNQEGLTKEFRALVEQQYCSVHGKFAEFEGFIGELGSEDGAQLRFTTCCDELTSTVRSLIGTGPEG